MRAYTPYAAATAALYSIALGSPLVVRDDAKMAYDFSELTASPELAWTPCYDNFTCALLEVPLDYAEPSIGTLNIAIIKKPGATEGSQEILVNPGGPGGSSVAMVLSGYEFIQDKVGTEYSLVGIDPRGVNNSGPSSDCFPGYPFQSRNAFMADVSSLPDIESEYVMRQQHQAILAIGRWCTSIFSVSGTAKYVNTVATAQDMLHYIELRAQDAGQPAEEAKLWYYGISYGSILGSTFASLYPSRIGRMIIDGVLDLEGYYSGIWASAIDDSDKAAHYFFKRCFEAGPLLCSFHQNATSWQEIESQYQDLVSSVKESPIGLGHPLSDVESAALGTVITPSVLKWTDIVSYMFSTSYNSDPLQFFAFDAGLVALQTGNYELLSSLPQDAQISSLNPDYDRRMALVLIECVDSDGRSNLTSFDDYKAHVEYMHDQSNYGGLSVASFSGPPCSQLNVYPPASQKFDGIPKIDNTSAPILFISGIADPITPLVSARKYHDIFQGSGLLLFNDSGHTAHSRKASCVAVYEKEYLLHGTLPPANTTCEVDEPNPFVAAAELLNTDPAKKMRYARGIY